MLRHEAGTLARPAHGRPGGRVDRDGIRGEPDPQRRHHPGLLGSRSRGGGPVVGWRSVSGAGGRAPLDGDPAHNAALRRGALRPDRSGICRSEPGRVRGPVLGADAPGAILDSIRGPVRGVDPVGSAITRAEPHGVGDPVDRAVTVPQAQADLAAVSVTRSVTRAVAVDRRVTGAQPYGWRLNQAPPGPV